MGVGIAGQLRGLVPGKLDLAVARRDPGRYTEDAGGVRAALHELRSDLYRPQEPTTDRLATTPPMGCLEPRWSRTEARP